MCYVYMTYYLYIFKYNFKYSYGLVINYYNNNFIYIEHFKRKLQSVK